MLCGTAISARQCRLWVNSVVSDPGGEIGFAPNSDRESGLPGGREVSIRTVVGPNKVLVLIHMSKGALRLINHQIWAANRPFSRQPRWSRGAGDGQLVGLGVRG